MVGDNYLTTVGMSPFLMTALLSYFLKTVAPQHANDMVRVANGSADPSDCNFNQLGRFMQRDFDRLEPEFKCLLRVGNGLLLCIASRGASGQFGKDRRIATRLWILLNYQAEFHAPTS